MTGTDHITISELEAAADILLDLQQDAGRLADNTRALPDASIQVMGKAIKAGVKTAADILDRAKRRLQDRDDD